MSEQERDLEPGSASLDAVDEDPPSESEGLAGLRAVREPADDDPPVEPNSPWDEVQVNATRPIRNESLSDEEADEDPPSEPRAVESIAHARR